VAARRINLLSGARSEYDVLTPVARALAERDGCEPAFVLGGPNLSPVHGIGVAGVERDGFRVAGHVESFVDSDSWEARSRSFAGLVDGWTRVLADDRPDLLIIAGDREEAVAGAMVGNMLRIPVAHLHGGDRCMASDVDEVFRPAISKLSHLHFTATEGHRQRLISMGELPDRVWTSGAPGLDSLRDQPDVPAATLTREFGVDVEKPFFLLIQHPSPTLSTNGYEEMREVLAGLRQNGWPVLCGYPNTDPGNVGIRRAITEARAADPNVVVFKVLPRDRFVALYRRAAAIVGNSSSIVFEAGFLKVPGILVGPRQDLREIGANVVRVPISAAAIRDACLRALNDDVFKRTVREAASLYGDGHASGRIAHVLTSVDLTSDLLLKVMPY
jgi:UDP-hydrolysing UDP-N-acetyl-D-glucosamine 2-epimerase